MGFDAQSFDKGLGAACGIYYNSVFVKFFNDLCQTVLIEDGDQGAFDFFHSCMWLFLFRLLLKDKGTIFICLFPCREMGF